MKKLGDMKIHIIGIGGTGMAPIGIVLQEMGASVSGSDRSESVYTQYLRSRGIEVFVPQCAENIKDPDIVFYSSAIHDDNPELAEVKKRGIRALKRREFLGFMLEGKKTIAVAGSHGKSTTTSMMAWTLFALGLEPGFIVGSSMKDLGKIASAGKSDWFVIEADEYDNMFLGLTPYTAALTKVEYDHPDCFPTTDLYLSAFKSFLNNTRKDGFILLNADDPNQSLLSIPEGRRVYRYSLQSPADFNAEELHITDNGCFSFVFTDGKSRIPVTLCIPGVHNVSNAMLVLSFCSVLGLDVSQAAGAVGSFHGISRRFEQVAEWKGIRFIDDYAHHPTEIRATLKAAREFFPGRRIFAVWQPHTYSRTKSLLSDFSTAFADADELIITDIYAAREKFEGFGISDVMNAMDHRSFRHLSSNEVISGYLAANLQSGDVVVILSAGDANLVAPMTVEILKNERN